MLIFQLTWCWVVERVFHEMRPGWLVLLKLLDWHVVRLWHQSSIRDIQRLGTPQPTEKKHKTQSGTEPFLSFSHLDRAKDKVQVQFKFSWVGKNRTKVAAQITTNFNSALNCHTPLSGVVTWGKWLGLQSLPDRLTPGRALLRTGQTRVVPPSWSRRGRCPHKTRTCPGSSRRSKGSQESTW